jgi:hypothetical protein
MRQLKTDASEHELSELAAPRGAYDDEVGTDQVADLAKERHGIVGDHNCDVVDVESLQRGTPSF